MAVVVILLGSFLGFVAAIGAYFVLDAGLLLALLIWLGAGPLSAILVVVASLRIPMQSNRKPSPVAVEIA